MGKLFSDGSPGFLKEKWSAEKIQQWFDNSLRRYFAHAKDGILSEFGVELLSRQTLRMMLYFKKGLESP